jgi:tRNA dimethylallyltransferase
MMQNKVIVVAGPTASGKTALSIEIAQKLNTEIINCDSRQLYQELNIGVARPTREELNAVKHHFVAEFSIFSPVSAGSFANIARLILHSIVKEKGTVVVCGGTGLYLKALLHGFDELPEVDIEIRQKVNRIYENEGTPALIQAIEQLDSEAVNSQMRQNPARLKRTLELLWQSPGKKLVDLRKNQEKLLPYPTDIICINHQKEALYARINERVDQMIEAGLKKEARELFPHKHLESLKTVGYSEFFRHFEGELNEEECINLIKQHTRNYAKRQVTWFKNQTPAMWIEPKQSIDSIFASISND